METLLSSWKKVARLAVYFTFLFITLTILLQVKENLVIFFIGSILAYILYPFIKKTDEFLTKIRFPSKLSRFVSILVVYIIFFSSAGYFVFVLGDMVVGQIHKLAFRFPEYSQSLVDTFTAITNDLDLQNKQAIQEALGNSLNTFGEYFQTIITGITSQAYTALRLSLTVLVAMILLPFWMFYVLYQPRKLADLLLSLVPLSVREDAIVLGKIANRIGQRYLKGQLLLCFVIGVVTYIGLLVLQVPYALPLAIFAGILEAVPGIGPILSAIPAIITTAPSGVGSMVSVAILYTIIQQLENHLLVPRIQASVVEFPEAMVFILLVIGGSLWGLGGMLVILPITAILRDMFHYIMIRLSDKEIHPDSAFKKVLSEPLSVDNL